MRCIFCCAFFLVANAVPSPRRRRDLLFPDHPGDAIRPTERPLYPLPRPRPRTDTPSAAPWCALALKVHLSAMSHRKMPPTSGPSIGPRTLASAAASPGTGVGAVMDVDVGVSTGAGASTGALAGVATGAGRRGARGGGGGGGSREQEVALGAIEGARVVRKTARRVALARPSEAEAFE